ncbi:hypothetical protein BXZ70DRAFT_920863 [Cristinia sonorae]|uniref:Uncharacterized protein n=1 Tax=Cristinia sonorae TaxID=1940300 RepID=A0A8K0UVH6_9AGAR|nr:hypothetical protein BXZ70DRAFT_920863 [Cristinia sonorae]
MNVQCHRCASLLDAESSSSMLTSSDKLSALPSQSSPNLNRLRGTTRGFIRSLDAATSPPLPSIESSPVNHAQRLMSSTSGASDSGSSVGRETPKQRVSFDSDRNSLPPNLQTLRQAVVTRTAAHSDSVLVHGTGGSPQLQVRPGTHPLQADGNQTPLSRSPTPSRATSPFRRFLHRAHSRDEPFIPVDPFKFRLQWFTSPESTPQRRPLDLDLDCEDTLTTCLPSPVTCGVPRRQLRNCGSALRQFFLDTLPRQVYLHLLLKLPAIYFSRVSRIFEDAEVSKHEIQRMIDSCATESENGREYANWQVPPSSSGVSLGRRGEVILPYPDEWVPPTVTPALARFKSSWELFIDSLLREWKTLNLVSALLCTAILTMFQVPDAAGDPLTRWAAILSLVFALMSLTYGCMYIVQFGTMRSMYKASRWAEEARKTRTFVWWNVWVLLATPAIWLAWSMIAFVVSILSYVWRTGATSDPDDGVRPALTPKEALAARIVVTCILCIGLLQFVMIIQTFRSYSGLTSRRRWRRGTDPAAQGGAEEQAGGSERNGRPRERQESRKEEPNRGRAEEKEKGGLRLESLPAGLGLTGITSSLKTFGSASAVLVEESGIGTEKKASGSIRNEGSARVSAEGGLGMGPGGSRPRISPKL